MFRPSSSQAIFRFDCQVSRISAKVLDANYARLQSLKTTAPPA
ncbi:MAG TPA: hypothetical protein VE985_02105 [Gaiellaceae bacterium]|nr:hypothetical protein [Gaiellaceae bacterium]